jgi:NADPH:quinone reductase-like Zn-dependent oxidoreductase
MRTAHRLALCGPPKSSARFKRSTTGSEATPRSASVLEARIAVIGATGAVGAVTIQLLRERWYGQVRAFASARSVDRQLDGGLVVEEATQEALEARH